MPIPDSFTKAGYTKDTKFKVIKADGPFKVGDIVVLDEDNSDYWSNGWAFFKNSEGYFHDLYFGGSRAEVEAIVEDKKEEKQLSEAEESFPNIEVRTPHVAKIITYRVHFNEMFHRDLSEEEAMAIYQQLKELLGEK